MLDKRQIRKRIEWILEHKQVANKLWFIEQLQGLLSSMDSPEIFSEPKKEEPENV